MTTLNEIEGLAARRLNGERGGAFVQIDGSRTAFGELAVAEKTPQVQAKFPYNINEDIVLTRTNNASSTVTQSGGVAIVTCAAAASARSQLRTLDVIRYGPGQGAEFLGTCAFTTGVANSTQILGPGNGDEGFFFGYNGTDFGILRRARGELEIRSLTITSGADAGGGDFIITMDGDAVTVTVAADDTISEVVAAIVAASDDFSNAGRGWEAHTGDNVTVQFISYVAENAAGTFSFADTDSGVTAGAFNQATTVIQGAAPTDTWTKQTACTVDAMGGSGPSRISLAAGVSGENTLDINNLNVFQIQYQYLGAGQVNFCIEDPNTGYFQVVHEIKYTGTSTDPTIANPTLHLSLIAQTESGYAGGALVMRTSSLSGFIEGKEALLGIRHSANNTKTTTGTTEVNVLTIHNQIDWQSGRNKVFVYPDYMTIASEAGKTVTILIRVNPTEIGGTVSYTDVESNHSVMQFDTAGTTVVNGEVRLPFTLSGIGEAIIDLKSMNMFLRPGDRWTITASLSSGADAPVTVGITWLERV